MTTYRVLDGARRDYVVGHWSPNFDTAGVAVDLNLVFPIDRLNELAAQGRIGKVADQHLAYAGNQWELSQIRMDGGPAGATFLREQGVDPGASKAAKNTGSQTRGKCRPERLHYCIALSPMPRIEEMKSLVNRGMVLTRPATDSSWHGRLLVMAHMMKGDEPWR